MKASDASLERDILNASDHDPLSSHTPVDRSVDMRFAKAAALAAQASAAARNDAERSLMRAVEAAVERLRSAHAENTRLRAQVQSLTWLLNARNSARVARTPMSP
jgi:hypothetical protein